MLTRKQEVDNFNELFRRINDRLEGRLKDTEFRTDWCTEHLIAEYVITYEYGARKLRIEKSVRFALHGSELDYDNLPTLEEAIIEELEKQTCSIEEKR